MSSFCIKLLTHSFYLLQLIIFAHTGFFTQKAGILYQNGTQWRWRSKTSKKINFLNYIPNCFTFYLKMRCKAPRILVIFIEFTLIWLHANKVTRQFLHLRHMSTSCELQTLEHHWKLFFLKLIFIFGYFLFGSAFYFSYNLSKYG